jgi:hypothetical protein
MNDSRHRMEFVSLKNVMNVSRAYLAAVSFTG